MTCDRCGSDTGSGGHECLPELRGGELVYGDPSRYEPLNDEIDLYRKAKEQGERYLREYRESHDEDEIERYLTGPNWQQVKAGFLIPGLHLHHILRRPHQRVNLPCNFLMVSARAHEFIHRFPHEGTIAALYAKMQSVAESNRGDMVMEWFSALGRSVFGYVEVKLGQGHVPEAFMAMAESILRLKR